MRRKPFIYGQNIKRNGFRSGNCNLAWQSISPRTWQDLQVQNLCGLTNRLEEREYV